jgi:hypothetical protein
MLGYSVAVTVALASIASIAVFRLTCRPYRIHHAMTHGK